MFSVELRNIGKDYPASFWGRPLRAVGDVSFSVAPGEVFGLLGPNRAGKTTIVKMLLSLCRPSRGQLLRFGRPWQDRSTLAQIGYVHENQAFPRYLSAQHVLEYYGALSLLAEPLVKRRVPELLARVGLSDRAREPIARFSKGMVQRLGLAQALLAEPELLVFDEPNEGLDLMGRQLVRDVVREQRDKGRTVLFVSHVLSEVEQICDRLAVIKNGELAYLGPLKDLTRDPQTGETIPLEKALEPIYLSALRK